MASLTKNKPQTALSPVTVATELHAIEIEEARIAARKAALRATLFDSLKAQGVRSVKLEDGTMYLRSERHTLKPVAAFKDEALKWALEHNALKIDSQKAFQILRRQLDLPKFFKVNVSEYLLTRPSNK